MTDLVVYADQVADVDFVVYVAPHAELNEWKVKRLAGAVIMHAMIEAAGKDKVARAEAENWLLSTDALLFFDGVDLTRQHVITWLEGKRRIPKRWY